VQARRHRGYGRGKRESVRNEEENIEALTKSHDIPPSFNLGVHIAPFNTVSTVNVVLYNNREGTQALPEEPSILEALWRLPRAQSSWRRTVSALST
jgi:hypothetical protein